MPARPAQTRHERRANERAERRAGGRRRVEVARAATRLWPRVSFALFCATAVVLLGMLMRGVLLKITWYLAVDQFGYLTFAHDLLHGHVFHHWRPMEAFVGRVPPRVDILAQTYVQEGDHAYCRYSPGFPLLLAAWIRLFGDDGAHYLNPTVFLTLLVVLLFLGRRLFRSWWYGLIAVAGVTLFPTYIHLWAITPTRDLAAHLAGFIGILLLAPVGGRPLSPRRVAAAGIAFGYAVTTRPDAVLYAIPGTALLALRWFRERRRIPATLPIVGGAVLGVVVGLAPLLVYDWMVMGNPIRPTQGMEVQSFFEKPAAPSLAPAPPAAGPKVGFPPPGWHGGNITAVQGGGLRLSNFATTFPGNVRIVRGGYSDLLLAVALVGAIVAAVRRRTLFVVAVPYSVIAFLFFSCWARPDNRYLSGVFCMLPLLIVEGSLGLVDLLRRMARGSRASVARGLAVAFAAALCGGVIGFPPPPYAALPGVVYTVVAVTATALVATAAFPARRATRLAAPIAAIVLTAIAITRGQASTQIRAGFQRPEMVRARETMSRLVEPGSIVVTTEDVGRPAENIEYYSGVAYAVYFTDLERWGVKVPEAAARWQKAGLKPYLLIPTAQPDHAKMLDELRAAFDVRLVASLGARQAMDVFVAAPFHHGVPMELWRIAPRA